MIMTGLGKCEHEHLTGPPTDVDGNESTYFYKQESAFQILRKLVTDKNWLKTLNAYTRFK